VSAAAALVEHYAGTYPDEISRALERLDPVDAAVVVSALPPERAAALLPHLAAGRASRVIGDLPLDVASAIIGPMRIDAVAALLRRMDPAAVSRLLDVLPAEQARGTRLLLAHAPGTAGAVMNAHVFTVPAAATVADARRLLETAPEHLYYYVYVVDAEHRLAGVLDIAELMQAPPGEPVRAIARPDVTWLSADAPLESVFAHPGWRTLDAIPVVDAGRRLLGVLRHRRMRELQEQSRPILGDDRTVRTVMALGEIYWLGLCGLLQGIASTATDSPARGEAS